VHAHDHYPGTRTRDRLAGPGCPTLHDLKHVLSGVLRAGLALREALPTSAAPLCTGAVPLGACHLAGLDYVIVALFLT